MKRKYVYVSMNEANLTEGHKLAIGLRAAYWAMHRRTNANLAEHGVTADQFVLLARLADQDGITQQELARRASSDPNTIRPMLLRLEKRGLVQRRTSKTDRRAHRVILTPRGRRELDAMMRTTARCRSQMVSGVKHGSAAALRKNLHTIAQVLEEAPHRDIAPKGSPSR